MSNYEDDLLANKVEINVFREQNIVTSGMPLKHYIQEGFLACSRFNRAKDTLTAGKMDFTRVVKLQSILGACRQLLTETSSVSFPATVSIKAWEKSVEEADLLLYFMKEASLFALREDEVLVNKVYSIYNEGGSNSDKIQDLNDFSLIGKDNAAAFTAIGFDLANFQRAAELAKEMDLLLAEATLDRSESPELRIRRDKAITIAKKLIDELNSQARYIFCAEKKKAAEFMIAPPRKKPTKVVADPTPATESVHI
jgi:hypothetical protein